MQKKLHHTLYWPKHRLERRMLFDQLFWKSYACVFCVSNYCCFFYITENELNIPVMVACYLAGSATVVGVIAIIRLVKYMKVRKKAKKGISTVQTIAPLPARPTVFTPRHGTNVLSFVWRQFICFDVKSPRSTIQLVLSYSPKVIFIGCGHASILNVNVSNFEIWRKF